MVILLPNNVESFLEVLRPHCILDPLFPKLCHLDSKNNYMKNLFGLELMYVAVIF